MGIKAQAYVLRKNESTPSRSPPQGFVVPVLLYRILPIRTLWFIPGNVGFGVFFFTFHFQQYICTDFLTLYAVFLLVIETQNCKF